MKKKATGRPRWLTEARFKLLGSRPDTKIAAAAGVHPSTVRRWRRHFKIPAFCPGNRGMF